MNVNYRPQVKSERIDAYSEMTALGVLPNSWSRAQLSNVRGPLGIVTC